MTAVKTKPVSKKKATGKKAAKKLTFAQAVAAHAKELKFDKKLSKQVRGVWHLRVAPVKLDDVTGKKVRS